MPETYVVAGANLAGGTAAATLRGDGFEGRVVLVGEEPVAPYERPPLSKEFLRGEVPFEKALIRPAGFWDANQIECRFGSRVARIDVGSRMRTEMEKRNVCGIALRQRRPRLDLDAGIAFVDGHAGANRDGDIVSLHLLFVRDRRQL